MPEGIYIGNFSKGLTLDRLPFVIDNDAFPTLYNAYSWRGRAKRKRGTSFLGRLQRILGTTSAGGNFTTTILPIPIPVEQVSFVVGSNVFTDQGGASPVTLATNGPGTATLNRTTGLLTITGSNPLTAVGYFPTLPVLGLEDLVSNNADSQFPLLVAFDTTYAYQFNQTTNNFYDVSYYKGTNNPVIWSNVDSAQFWSTNYQSAFWVTNNKPGFHFVNGTYISGSGTNTITFNFKSNAVNFTTLVIGDQLFFNEWPTVVSPLININGLVGVVSSIAGAAAGNYDVTFTTTPTVSGTGIAQLLTNSIPGQDGIRWYDGDPTNGTGLPVGNGLGWVNFAPPLTATTVGINDQTPALYYLVGALAILPFKDRLLFFGPQIQQSGGAVIQKPLQDTVLWSWNGTPYYNSFVPTNTTNTETFDITAYYVDQTGKGGYLPAGISKPIKTVFQNEDVLLIGFGGSGFKTRFVYTGNDLQPFLFYLINSQLPSTSTFSGVTLDRGGLEVGTYGITITNQQSCERIDLQIPDEVFEIQALNQGQNRVNAQRDFFREWVYFTYPTGDGNANTGSWIYPSRSFMLNYRDNTWAILRENYTHHGLFRKSSHYTWATLPFKTWASWTEPWNAGSTTALFPSVIAGNPQGFVILKDAEGGGESRSGAIAAIANDGFGNTQITSVNHCVNSESSIQGTNGDYLLFQNAVQLGGPFATVTITGVTQSNPAVITAVNTFSLDQEINILSVAGMVQLNSNTYTIIAVTGTTITINVDSTNFSPYVSGGIASAFNGVIGLVIRTIDANNFVVDIPFPGAGYVGLGTYARLSQPLIQTKQFAPYWQEGRKVRLAVQKYLFDRTSQGQVTVDINLSQDPNTTWNEDPEVPAIGVTNNSLIYSQMVFTCPESTNLGLTPSNINLQMPTAATQFQIWHRMNTSLIGDSVQIGITLNDTQMRNLTIATSEIALHAIHLTVERGPLLS